MFQECRFGIIRNVFRILNEPVYLSHIDPFFHNVEDNGLFFLESCYNHAHLIRPALRCLTSQFEFETFTGTFKDFNIRGLPTVEHTLEILFPKQIFYVELVTYMERCSPSIVLVFGYVLRNGRIINTGLLFRPS